MGNDRYCQGWDCGDGYFTTPGVVADFNMGGFTDLVAGVLFKIGPAAVPTHDSAGWPSRFLFGNADVGGGTGWGFDVAMTATGPAVRAHVVGVSQDWVFQRNALPISPNPGAGIVDRLIFACLHIRGSDFADFYLNGNRVSSQGGSPYVDSVTPPRIGRNIAGNVAGAGLEIVGACFSRFNGVNANTGALQGVMLQAYRQAHENNKIGMLYANGISDWDHKWNAAANPGTGGKLVQGPNGGYYYPDLPRSFTTVADEGNSGAEAATSTPTPVAMQAQLGKDGPPTVVTTRNPGWYEGAFPFAPGVD